MKMSWKPLLPAALLLCLAPLPAAASSLDDGSAIASQFAPRVAAFAEQTAVPQSGRFLLVDLDSARLFMVADGQIEDSMRVIVGKETARTPELSGVIYRATVNPYWNVPPDLARDLIAPRVLKEGNAYLRKNGYEVVDNWGADGRPLPYSSVDWKAVAAGREEVRLRQKPGAANSMGQIKFGFANPLGIYLHDTPRKGLFEKDDRRLSNGCIRLEDADRLSRWLMGETPTSATPEQHVALPTPVKVVITHLSQARPERIAALR